MSGSAMVDAAFWRGRRVMLTGHTGFKGAWLSLWLQSLGASVRGVALPPPTSPSLFEVARVRDGMQHRVADIRDFQALDREVSEFGPEVLIHLAAQPLVRRSYADPLETYATNVMGTANLLEAVRRVGSVRALVNVTTDKCYLNREWVWGYREDDPMGGDDPYSSSKACVELLSASYRTSFLKTSSTAMATARAGNVIGGGDWAADRLVPDVLKALEAGETIHVRHPDGVRPWQHVLEPLSGYLLLAQKLVENGQDYAEAWNFGPVDEGQRTVRWVVERLCGHWGREAAWATQVGPRPHEAHSLKLDISKARHRLEWYPRWTLDGALGATVAWHRAWLSGADMRGRCLEQIASYGEIQ